MTNILEMFGNFLKVSCTFYTS